GGVGSGAAVADAAGAEAELLLEHALGGHALHLVHAEGNPEVQPRIADADYRAEALDDRALLGLHGIEARGSRPDEQDEQDDGEKAEATLAAAAASATAAPPAPPPAAATATREDLLEHFGQVGRPGIAAASRADVDGCGHESPVVNPGHSLTGRATSSRLPAPGRPLHPPVSPTARPSASSTGSAPTPPSSRRKRSGTRDAPRSARARRRSPAASSGP